MLEIIIIFLLLFIGVQEYFNRIERKHLVESVIAKNLKELSDLETQRSFKPQEEKAPEFVPVSELDDDKFDDYINKVNEQE